MDTFTVRDLREHTGDLIHDAEAGKLSLITKHGHPVILAVPFTQDLLDLGMRPALAVKLFQQQTLSLGKSAKLADMSLSTFIDLLGRLGIPVAQYPADEIAKELKDFG